MANRRALIREADLQRIFRAAKKEGVNVQVAITAEYGVTITTGKAAPAAANANSFDEMF